MTEALLKIRRINTEIEQMQKAEKQSARKSNSKNTSPKSPKQEHDYSINKEENIKQLLIQAARLKDRIAGSQIMRTFLEKVNIVAFNNLAGNKRG